MSTAEDSSRFPDPGSIRCPRCSAALGPEQDWCLECGAPARTRLAPTPNWRLPTVAIGAMIALAGALLAFAFVKLTSDDGAPAGTTPAAVVESEPPAAVAPPAPAAATTATTATIARQPSRTATATTATPATARRAASSPPPKTTTTPPRTRTITEAKVPEPPP